MVKIVNLVPPKQWKDIEYIQDGRITFEELEDMVRERKKYFTKLSDQL